MSILSKIKSLITDNYDKQSKSNISKLSHLIARELNILDLTLKRTEQWRDIDLAKGLTLNKIGRNFVEPRLNRTDAEYRSFIMTKIFANRSAGDIETINQICKALYGSNFLRAEELWNNSLYNNEYAAFKIVFNDSVEVVVPSPYILRVAAGGVRIAWEIDIDPQTIGVNSNMDMFQYRSCKAGGFTANSCFGGSKFRRGRL